jgi:hypothetical protein
MMNRNDRWKRVLVFLCLLLPAFFSVLRSAEGQTQDLPNFNQLGKPLRDLASGEPEALVSAVVSRIRGEKGPVSLPDRLRNDTEPRICFVTLADGKGKRKVSVGSGWGLAEAVSRAAEGLSRDPLSKSFRWMKLDIVRGAQVLKTFDLEQALPFDTSLFGLSIQGETDKSLLPEELAILASGKGKRFSAERANQLLWETRIIPWRSGIGAGKQKVVVFNTISLFGSGDSAWRLFRGNREWAVFSKADIDGALKMAGRYLVRAVKDDGSFVYEYDPFLDRAAADYNILRHAGTVFSMMELYGRKKDPEVLKAAEKAVGFLLRQIHDGVVSGKPVKFVVEGSEIKLGGNGLAALALAEYARVTGNRSHDATMKGLGEWILATQAPDGRFTVHKQDLTSGRISSFQSEYYPGEAIFALVRLYSLTGEKKWLDAAEKGAIYQLKNFSRLDDSELPHDHWLLYGLNEVHRKRPRAEFLEGAMRFARVIVEAQHTRKNQPQPDWDGGYYKPPRSAPTATRMEGLDSAYALARDFGKAAQAKEIRQAIERGTGFLLRVQVGPETGMYCRNPERSLGGFRESLVSPIVRIDYVQHAISALIHLPE